MPLPSLKKHVRGMQDIKNSSGKIDHLSHPHMAYLRLSVLEMEKARRNKEKETALRRVRAVEARLREIEEEKSAIESVLEVKEASTRAYVRKLEEETTQNFGGFKIMY